jgi:hypothetical protein
MIRRAGAEKDWYRLRDGAIARIARDVGLAPPGET